MFQRKGTIPILPGEQTHNHEDVHCSDSLDVFCFVATPRGEFVAWLEFK